MISKENIKNIITLIKSNKLEELQNFIEKNNFILQELNQDNFDILINAIENDATVEIIKYIIKQCQYKTLNYTKYYKKRNTIDNNEEFSIYYKVPLFSAVNKENFKIAKFLLDNNADINYTISNNGKDDITIIHYLCQPDVHNIDLNRNKLLYILQNDYHLKGIDYNLMCLFVKVYKNDLLKVIFKHFIFDNEFILNLINLQKHKISLSSEQLHKLIILEKSKIDIKEFTYKEVLKGAKELRFKTIETFIEYESKSPQAIFDIIRKYKIMEKAVKHYNYGYNLVKKLLSYSKLDVNSNYFENSFVEAIKTKNNDIISLFIEVLNKCSTQMNVIKFNRILFEITHNEDNQVIKQIIDFCLTYPEEEQKKIDFEKILLEACKISSIILIKDLLELLLKYHLIDVSWLTYKKMMLKTCQNSNGLENMKYFLDLLTQSRLDIDIKNIPFDVILLEACRKKKEKIIKLMISTLIPLNAFSIQEDIFKEILIESCNFEDVEIMKYLVDSILVKPILDRKTVNFESVLLEMSTMNYGSISRDKMKYLIEEILNISMENVEDLDVSYLNNYDTSFLSLLLNISIKIQNIKLIQYLVENEELKPKININAKDKNNDYPIFTAYFDRMNYNESIGLKIFNYLLEIGADGNLKYRDGSTVLLLALKNKNYPKIKSLLHYPINFSETIDDSTHPLIKAIAQNDLNAVQLFWNKSKEKTIMEKAKATPPMTTTPSSVTTTTTSPLTTTTSSTSPSSIATTTTIPLTTTTSSTLSASVPAPASAPSPTTKEELKFKLIKTKVYGMTPLIFSYLYRRSPQDQAIFQFLLNQSEDMDINAMDEFGYSLLHYAILKEDLPTIQALIHHRGANINYYKGSHNRGNSALDIGIGVKNPAIINLLLNSDGLQLNQSNQSGEIPLVTLIKSYLFTTEEKLQMMEDFIARGSNVNFKNIYEYTPIFYAICEKSLPLIQLLVAKGAEVNINGEFDDNSPLINAIETGSLPIIQLLIDKGADTNLIDQSGYNPLVYAIDTKSLEIVQLLVSHGADIHHVLEDDYGREITVLTYAIILGYVDIIRYLMACEAEITFEFEYTYTNLIHAIAKHGKVELFGDLANYTMLPGFMGRLLQTVMLSEEEKEKEKEKEDGTLRWRSKIELLEILANQQLDLNAKDSQGNTALVYAIEVGNGPVAEFLIEHGADLRSVNDDGESIYDISAKYSDTYWGQRIFNRIKALLHP